MKRIFDKYNNFVSDNYNIVIITALFFIIVGPLLIHIFFKTPAYFDYFVSLWNAGDALSYFGSVLTLIGTSILGGITFMQNNKLNGINKDLQINLQKIEKSNFIANNSILATINKIKFVFKDKIIVNYNLHQEQLLTCFQDQDEKPDNQKGFECLIELKSLKGFPALVFVKEVDFFVGKVGDLKLESLFSAKNIYIESRKKKFSKIAIDESGGIFKMTLIFSSEEIENIMKKLNDSSLHIEANIKFTVLSTNLVSTDCVCRSSLTASNYDENLKCYTEFEIDYSCDFKPRIFWDNYEVVNIDEIEII